MSEEEKNLDTNTETVVQDDVEATVEFTPFIEVGGEQIEIKKLSAYKVASVSNILAEWLLKGNRKLNEFKYGSNNMAFVVGMLAALDEESLVRFASTLIERDVEFVKEHFDLAWVLNALAIQMQVSNLRAVITNFTYALSQIQ